MKHGRKIIRLWWLVINNCEFIYYSTIAHFLGHPDYMLIMGWFRKNVRGFGFRKNNWGDDLNIDFIPNISKSRFRFITCDSRLWIPSSKIRIFLCIGSILQNPVVIKSKCKFYVWGTGIKDGRFTLSKQCFDVNRFKIHSVRGPLTRDCLIRNGISCPEIYGDPALLISRYYNPNVEILFEYGIITHLYDPGKDEILKFCSHHKECLFIDMGIYNDWHEVVDKVCSCRKILSSSLHGLIVADSYSIPNGWIKHINSVEPDFKYRDYLMSVNRDNEKATSFSSESDFEDIILSSHYGKAANIDFDAIFQACPFKDKLIHW